MKTIISLTLFGCVALLSIGAYATTQDKFGTTWQFRNLFLSDDLYAVDLMERKRGGLYGPFRTSGGSDGGGGSGNNNSMSIDLDGDAEIGVLPVIFGDVYNAGIFGDVGNMISINNQQYNEGMGNTNQAGATLLNVTNTTASDNAAVLTSTAVGVGE